MTITEGKIKYWSKEIEELVLDYYKTTIASKNMAPLKFKWTNYIQLEEALATRLFVASEEEKLIGFSLYLVQAHLHHENQIVAHCTMLGVRPEFRNRGIGRQLIKQAEYALRRSGVTHLVHSHRAIYDSKPLFEHLGFRLEELGYVKEL